MSFSHSERIALAELFREVGPDAPTLCDGWNARDLLVHLVIRENDVKASAGNISPRFHDALARRTDELSTEDYDELVSRWESGSSLWFLRPLDRFINLTEHFVHHEDVRRCLPGAQPRHFSSADESQLYRALPIIAFKLLGQTPVPVVAEPTGWPRVVIHDKRGVATAGDAVVTVRGDVGEIVLWLFGRDVARVDVKDPSSALQRTSV